MCQNLSATGGGINYYASQLGGFKAEIKEHMKALKKFFENVNWDWCQGAKGQVPMWEAVANAMSHMATKFEESQEMNKRNMEGQAELIAEIKQMNQMF